MKSEREKWSNQDVSCNRNVKKKRIQVVFLRFTVCRLWFLKSSDVRLHKQQQQCSKTLIRLFLSFLILQEHELVSESEQELVC